MNLPIPNTFFKDNIIFCESVDSVILTGITQNVDYRLYYYNKINWVHSNISTSGYNHHQHRYSTRRPLSTGIFSAYDLHPLLHPSTWSLLFIHPLHPITWLFYSYFTIYGNRGDLAEFGKKQYRLWFSSPIICGRKIMILGREHHKSPPRLRLKNSKKTSRRQVISSAVPKKPKRGPNWCAKKGTLCFNINSVAKYQQWNTD